MRGYYLAQLKLGKMYEDGRGVSQDMSAAYALYSIASKCFGRKSVDDAIENRDRVLSKFSSIQLENAQKSTRTFSDAITNNYGLPEPCLY